jgi:hypothetical protein
VTDADRRYVFGVVASMLVVAVYGQRFTLPAGGVPLALPLVGSYVAVFLLRVRGGIRYNRVRTELYVMAAAAVVVASWFSAQQGHGLSVNSLFLLLVIYLPWVFCVATSTRAVAAGRAAVRAVDARAAPWSASSRCSRRSSGCGPTRTT